MGLFGLHFQVMVHHHINKGRSLRQKLKRGHGGRVLTSLTLMACSACSLAQPRTTTPGLALSRVGWAHPHKSSVKKIPPETPQLTITLLKALLPCQADKNLASTELSTVCWKRRDSTLLQQWSEQR